MIVTNTITKTVTPLDMKYNTLYRILQLPLPRYDNVVKGDIVILGPNRHLVHLRNTGFCFNSLESLTLSGWILEELKSGETVTLTQE